MPARCRDRFDHVVAHVSGELLELSDGEIAQIRGLANAVENWVLELAGTRASPRNVKPTLHQTPQMAS